MKTFKYSHISIPTVLTLALVGGACKSDCEKAIDHLAHLAWVQNQKEVAELTKDLPHYTPEFEAEVAKYTPTEAQMLPMMRDIGKKRFGARCQDPAFTKCVLASTHLGDVAQCEDPMTREQSEEAERALEKLRDSDSAEAKPTQPVSKKTGGR
jgi:hypothetical protein